MVHGYMNYETDSSRTSNFTWIQHYRNRFTRNFLLRYLTQLKPCFTQSWAHHFMGCLFYRRFFVSPGPYAIQAIVTFRCAHSSGFSIFVCIVFDPLPSCLEKALPYASWGFQCSTVRGFCLLCNYLLPNGFPTSTIELVEWWLPFFVPYVMLVDNSKAQFGGCGIPEIYKRTCLLDFSETSLEC